MTMGPGDLVWERFGHNALWVQDEATGWGAAYNWGIFDFGQVDFIPRLIKGTMLYSMAPYDPAASLEEYRRADRPVWVQELDLTPAQKADLFDYVRWNALPENRDYRYDYYRDNCSTRIRDVLDGALSGALRASTESDTTAFSYRWHTRRLLQGIPAAYLGIQFVLGAAADRPITGWEEMFLPMRLMARIDNAKIPDGAGGWKPLVVGQRQVLDSSRPPPPSEPPFALPWFLGSGIVFSLAFLALVGRGRPMGTWRRLGVAVAGGGWTLLATVSGSLLLGAWLFTDHEFWYANLNLLQVNTAFLPLVFAFGVYGATGNFPRWGKTLARVLVGASVLGALIWLWPGLGQNNGEILALLVPVNLALLLGILRLRDPREDESGQNPLSSQP
jgi:hypothetical protein